MKLKDLIMDSYVLSTEKKLELINSIKKWELKEEEITKIIKFLINQKNEIDKCSDKYINDMKKEYIKYLNKKVPILKQEVTRIKIKTKETISNEKEWNPDDLLNFI